MFLQSKFIYQFKYFTITTEHIILIYEVNKNRFHKSLYTSISIKYLNHINYLF